MIGFSCISKVCGGYNVFRLSLKYFQTIKMLYKLRSIYYYAVNQQLWS